MGLKDWAYTKKGLLIGIFLGLLFGIYSNITHCHTSPGGPSGCHNSLELYIAVFEFCLWIVPAILLSWIPNFLDSMTALKIVLSISPIIFFGLTGLLIGLIIGNIKSKKQ